MSDNSINWARGRFQANFEDSRPVKFPPPGPYWETGFNAYKKYSIIVAYFPSCQKHLLKEYWPEASNVEWIEDVQIVFTDRFECPEWWNKENMVPNE